MHLQMLSFSPSSFPFPHLPQASRAPQRAARACQWAADTRAHRDGLAARRLGALQPPWVLMLYVIDTAHGPTVSWVCVTTVQ